MDKKHKPQSEYERDLSAEEQAAEVLTDADRDSRSDYESNSVSGVRQAKIQMTPRKEYIPSSEGLEEFNLQIENDAYRESFATNDSESNGLEKAKLYSKKTSNGSKKHKQVLNASEDIFTKRDKRVVVLEILDWIKYILVAVILGLLISKFVIQRSEVVGRSMEDTLHNDDQLIVDKLSLHFSHPQRGDIVTVNGAKTHKKDETAGMLVKRVVAIPGDTLDFKDGKVIVNGEEIEENYLSPGTYTMEPFDWQGEITVPAGHYFVLGDNRGNSADSRIFGPVPEEAIEGKVWIRIYPFDKFGKID